MDRITINISREFSITPGPRQKKEGSFSAEEFLDKILREKFKEAIQSSSKLRIILDGTAGYATSFLEESFGGLQRENPNINVLDYLEFVAIEEPYLIDEINEY